MPKSYTEYIHLNQRCVITIYKSIITIPKVIPFMNTLNSLKFQI